MGRPKRAEKICPTCQTPHQKRGEFCSRSCGNSRTWTEETKEKFSKARTAYFQQDNDQVEYHKWQAAQSLKIANAQKAGEDLEEISTEEFYMMPEITDHDDREFIEDGTIWHTVD
jgi:hypothetical protein